MLNSFLGFCKQTAVPSSSAKPAGNVETTHRHDFADGSRAHIAAETFTPAAAPDANWEETGIIPDIEIEQSWHEFATPEEDKALTAAIE